RPETSRGRTETVPARVARRDERVRGRMSLLHRLVSIIRWIARPGPAEAQLSNELQTDVEMSADEKKRDGPTREDAYRLARTGHGLARMELGGVEQAKERVRAERHGYRLDEIARDVRYAARMFAAHRGFTAVLLITLALGIGANTTIFSLIDALMLRTLPVPNAKQLVLVTLRDRATPNSGGETFSYAIVRALDERHNIFMGAGGFTASDFDIGPAGSVSRVHGGLVTGNFFAMLGLQPAAGRLLTRDDDEPNAALVAVISDGYWQREYAHSSSALGQRLIVNGKPVTIVG